MLLIASCHIASYHGLILISQVLNVGVPIFFMISGYLYGGKQINSAGKFIFKRYLRLEIPALFWLCIVIIFDLIHNSDLPKLHECVFIILNLQGLNFIFSSIEDLFIEPWFFTNIMACYVLLILYLKVEIKHPAIKKMLDGGGIIPLLIFILLGLLRISTDGALAFFIGFSLKRKALLEKLQKKDISYLSLLH